MGRFSKCQLSFLFVTYITGILCIQKYVISCVGDSITVGSGVLNKKVSSYPANLYNYMINKTAGKFELEVLNFGLSGATAQRNSDKPWWTTSTSHTALATHSNIVVFQFGTNDAKLSNWNEENFVKDYSKMIRVFRNLSSHPIIFICIPPPYYAGKPIWGIQSEIINEALPRVVSRIAKETNSYLINNFQVLGGRGLEHPAYFFNSNTPFKCHNCNDGCHPNEKGYIAMGYNVFQAIDKVCLLNKNSKLGSLKSIETLKSDEKQLKQNKYC